MEDQAPSRRIVLRRALAIGCTVSIPVAFSGCDAKKSAEPASPTPSAAPASPPPAETQAPPATGKVAQASVQYQLQPKGAQRCGLCMHFIPESNTCKLVEGQISPDGWCTLWAQKA